jgi:hypothetical protein
MKIQSIKTKLYQWRRPVKTSDTIFATPLSALPFQTNFPGFSPANNSFLQDHINLATETQFEYVLQLTGKAFVPYRNLSTNERAKFLDAIA